MRTDDGFICDSERIHGRKPPACTVKAQFSLFCQVEGKELHLCPACKAAWNRRIGENAKLTGYCPNCAGRVNQATITPIPQVPVHPVTDIFREAIEHAMLMEGILEPVRIKVMARLAYEAPWMCEKPDEEVALCRRFFMPTSRAEPVRISGAAVTLRS